MLLVVVGTSYVLAHSVMERLKARFAFAGGLEYIGLGLVLGPLLGVLNLELIRDLRPILLLGVGAMGLLAGLELGLDRRSPKGTWVAAISISGATAVFVAGLPLVLAAWLGGSFLRWPEWTGAVLAAAIIAVGSDGGAIRAIATRLGAAGSTIDLGVSVAHAVRAIATVGFGLFFALFPPGDTLDVREPLSALTSFVLQLGVGVALGLLFSLLCRRRLDERTSLVFVVGMVLLAGGFAYAMGVSAIFVNFIMGLTLARVSGRADQILLMIGATREPFVIALYFFAGLEWVGGPGWMFAIVLPLVLLRHLGRGVGGWLGARLARVSGNLGACATVPGGLSLAFLLSIGVLFREAPGIADGYGPLLLAIVVLELGSARAGRRWILDVADTLGEVEGR